MRNEQSVVTEIINGLGVIKLNRPRALNALNLEMVKLILEQIKAWEQDHRVALVCIYGEGEKGLCAGGDMRTFYDLKDDGAVRYGEQFFSIEYEMDLAIHQYPKPVVVYMNGIVMGGGVGISIGASHRIVTETTKWAMPEMNIGFFPDVGASYFLNHMPGYVGRYLALTSKVIKAEDVLYIGAADYLMDDDDWPQLKGELEGKVWETKTAREELDRLLKNYSKAAKRSTLGEEQVKIDKHFQAVKLEDIMSSLKKSKEEWEEQTVKTIQEKSPTALKVTLKHIAESKGKSLGACLEIDKTLAINFLNCHDFYEGVRSVLVDKDRSPRWEPRSIEEVSNQMIEAFFQ